MKLNDTINSQRFIQSKFMKSVVTLLMLFGVFVNINAKIQCYIKIGFSDCINCYNVLSSLRDFDKEYVLKSEFKGIEQEILKEYLGITDAPKVYASDSFYNSFGFTDFTVIAFRENGHELLKFPMSSMNYHLDQINELRRNQIVEQTKKIGLLNNWHNQCQLKLLQSENFVILDPLRRKISKFNNAGKLIHSVSASAEFTKKIYQSNFNNGADVLKDYQSISAELGRSGVPLHFLSMTTQGEFVFLQVSGNYFEIVNRDTILATFYSLVKLNSDFNIQIIKRNDNLGNGYFLSSLFINVVNDSNVLCDVLCTNPQEKPYVIAQCKIKNNNLQFDRYLDDTIPGGLVDKRLNYRITSFCMSEGYVGYAFFNKIFYRSAALPNLKLFDNFVFTGEFLNPKNFITDIKKVKNSLYISYQKDSINYVVGYDLKTKTLREPTFSISQSKINSFIQLDIPNKYYYVDNDKQLVICSY